MQAVCCCYWDEPIDQWGRVKMTEGPGVEELAQSVKYLPSRNGDPNLTPNGPQNPFKKCQAWWNGLIFPQLQRQTQVDLWGSLPSQPHLAGQLGKEETLVLILFKCAMAPEVTPGLSAVLCTH